jgi:hypothetical protein
MTAAWTVKDRDGQLLADFIGASPLEVGRRIVPARYDAFRLQVSSSYREMFERAVAQVLERQGWQIVRIKAQVTPAKQRSTEAACAHAA